MDMDRLVKVYTKIRDKRGAIKKAYEAEDAALKESLEKIEAVLLHHLNTSKSESIRTEAGTFYKQKDVIPSCSDWPAFYEWIKKNDAFDALERRVKKVFITDYMEENKSEDGESILPPGISTFKRFNVRVRKNS